jgi:tetratricopeptide (TPR) repeat protein
MRLQLAHRYFDQQDLDAALEHYLAVLDREPNPEALSRVGWITFLSGEPELAVQLLEESLARQPDDPVATWFLANVRLYGLGDPARAVPLLEELLARREPSCRKGAVVECQDGLVGTKRHGHVTECRVQIRILHRCLCLQSKIQENEIYCALREDVKNLVRAQGNIPFHSCNDSCVQTSKQRIPNEANRRGLRLPKEASRYLAGVLLIDLH